MLVSFQGCTEKLGTRTSNETVLKGNVVAVSSVEIVDH